MALSGLRIATTSFERGMKQVKKLVDVNTMLFGRSVANEFERTAKANAPWTNRTGNARRNLYGTAQTISPTRVRIDMGGYAPNYKKSSNYRDYMELLEFADGGKNAIIYPTFSAICADVKQQYGDSVIKTGAKFRINRSKTAMRRRYLNYKARNK